MLKHIEPYGNAMELWPNGESRLRLNFSTHVPLGDVPKRHVPLRKRGERLLFADEPD